MNSESVRYHALDSLRGFAMLLGVVLHAGMSFELLAPASWPVRDNDPNLLVDLFVFAVHAFRMQLFFLLAGFFGCLLYQRYGLGGMARHRVERVALPLALSVPLILPAVMAAFLYAELENVRAQRVPKGTSDARSEATRLLANAPDKRNVALAAEGITSRAFLARLAPMHLWFLLYLLYFYAAVVVLAPLLGRLTGTRLLAAADGAFRRLIEGRWRVAVAAAVTVPPLLAMRTWISDTPLGWAPEWHILGYYSGFFAFGWVLYRHRDLVTAFGRGWRTNFAAANLLVLPVALGLLLGGITAEKNGEGVFGWRVAAFTAQAAYTWLMIAGLWGAFLHYFSRASAWVRYLADASYWCYLASLTPIVVLQLWVKDWPLPGPLKWAVVSTATMAVLFLSYDWFVRYTFVGAILSGRRTRGQWERPLPLPLVPAETRVGG